MSCVGVNHAPFSEGVAGRGRPMSERAHHAASVTHGVSQRGVGRSRERRESTHTSTSSMSRSSYASCLWLPPELSDLALAGLSTWVSLEFGGSGFAGVGTAGDITFQPLWWKHVSAVAPSAVSAVRFPRGNGLGFLANLRAVMRTPVAHTTRGYGMVATSGRVGEGVAPSLAAPCCSGLATAD